MLQDINNSLSQIDLLEYEEESNENHDLVLIQLLSNKIHVKYSQLCKYSKLIPNKYLICDIEILFSQDIQKFQQAFKIGDESIINFFKIFDDEKIIINNDKFIDFYKLSEFLQIKPFLKKLKKYQSLHINDLDFIIMTILNEISVEDEFYDVKNELNIQNEQFLINKINECLKNDKFKKFPVSLIYSMIDKSDKRQISSDLLFDFILQSMEKYFVLLTFLDVYTLSNEKFNEFCNIFINSVDENITKYSQYLRFDIKHIKELKDLEKNYNKIKKENQNLNNLLNQTNKEKQKLNYLFNKMKEENQNLNNLLNQTNKEKQVLNDLFNKMKEENQNLKEENNLFKNQIDKSEINSSNIFKGIKYYSTSSPISGMPVSQPPIIEAAPMSQPNINAPVPMTAVPHPMPTQYQFQAAPKMPYQKPSMHQIPQQVQVGAFPSGNLNLYAQSSYFPSHEPCSEATINDVPQKYRQLADQLVSLLYELSRRPNLKAPNKKSLADANAKLPFVFGLLRDEKVPDGLIKDMMIFIQKINSGDLSEANQIKKDAIVNHKSNCRDAVLIMNYISNTLR